jgi:hypothetical protein
MNPSRNECAVDTVFPIVIPSAAIYMGTHVEPTRDSDLCRPCSLVYTCTCVRFGHAKTKGPTTPEAKWIL